MNSLTAAVKLAIKGDSKGGVKALRDLEKQTQSSSRGFSSWGKTAKAAAKLATVGIGLAVGALYVLKRATKAVINEATEQLGLLVKLKRQTDGSTEATSLLAGQLRLSGVNMDTVSKGLVFLNKNLYAARNGAKTQSEAFKALNIDIKDSDGKFRSVSDILPELRTRIAGLEDPTKRTALVMQLFGKSGTELLPWLTKSQDEIDGYTQQIRKLGIFTEADMEIFGRFRANQRLMSYFFDMVKVKAGLFAMTLINKVFPVLEDLYGKYAPQVKEALKGMADWWGEHGDTVRSVFSFVTDHKEAVVLAFGAMWAAALGPAGQIAAAAAAFAALKAELEDLAGIQEKVGVAKILDEAEGWANGGPFSDANKTIRELNALLVTQSTRIIPENITSLKGARDAMAELAGARLSVKALQSSGVFSQSEAATILATIDKLEKGARSKWLQFSANAGNAGKTGSLKLRAPFKDSVAFPGISGAEKEGKQAGKDAREAAAKELAKQIAMQIKATVTLGIGGGTGAGLPSIGGAVNGMRAAQFATQQLGDAYRVGATGPDVWDCSGLAMGAYRAAGLSNFPTYTGNQWVLGRQIPKSQVRAGDQIFMKTGIPQWTDAFGWGHTGVAVSSTMMVHASGSKTGVIKSPIGAGYPWAARRHFAADGANFLTDGPTLILAGEKETEHVKITPAPKMNVAGGDGVYLAPVVTVEFSGDMYLRDEDEAAETMAEIQQAISDGVRTATIKAIETLTAATAATWKNGGKG